jgi:Mce-associated membrane protein
VSAGPSWYDVLGVDPAADADVIRAAWRAGIADLDPSDRRFRSLNQAAEVLLDPASRATYDASLVEPERDADPAPVATTAAAPPTLETGRTKAPKAPTAPKAPKEPKAPRPERTPSRLPLVPAWVLLVVAVLAAAGVATATLAAVQAGEPVSDRGGVLVEQSAEEARAAAIRAIVPVLSYDYRSLEEDAAAARSYMTSSYQEEKYDPLFAVIEENAPNTQTVVGAQVVDSAIVRTGDDRVDVLLFVDRPTTNKQVRQPIVYKDQLTVTMARVDGQWLVDDLTTSPIDG